MLLAIFATSCNKYADDFDQINTKLDALATSVAGVAQLTSDMSALKSQVTALQGVVATLPTKAQTDASFLALTTSLGVISGKIDAITTTLGTIASTGTATKGVVDQLKLDLAALALKVTNDNATMTTALNGLALDNVTMKANLQTIITANTALANQITAVQDQITALVDATGTSATAVTIKGLQLMLEAQKISLDQLLANSNMYNGPVNITSDAEVAFWLPKIGVWKDGGMVNGTLNINSTAITSLADLKTITDNLLAVIGGLGSDFTLTTKAGQMLTFAKLASTTGSVTVTTAAAGAADQVSFPALVSVGEDYAVTGKDIDDAVLATVTGNVTLTYDGGYSQPALATAANVILADYKTSAVTGNIAVGTLTVDLSGLTAVTTSVHTATNAGLSKGYLAGDAIGAAANTVSFLSATSVNLGAGAKIVSASANAANTVTLGYTGTDLLPLASLTVSATKAASVVTANVNTLTGALAITGSATSSVSLPNLVTVGTTTAITAVTLSAPNVEELTGVVTLTSTNPVSLPKLEVAGAITAATAVSFSAPVLVSAGVTVAAAKTVELGSTDTANLTAGVVETLKINALDAVLVASSTVKSATVTGKNAATYGALVANITAGGNNLVSLTLGGVIKFASVTASTSLTSLTTTGVVNSLTVDACTNAALTSLALGHTHYVGGPGSTLVLTGNTKLTSLMTSTDYMAVLTVTGNSALATMNFASYVTPLNPALAPGTAVAITINTNKLVGTYTPAVAATLTTPFVEAKLTCSSLITLKSYVNTMKTAGGVAVLGYALTLAVNIDDIDAVTAGNQLLSATMTDVAVPVTKPTVVDATAAINTAAEYALFE